MDSAQVRVLIVDDHDLFRTGLRSILEEEGFEVADAAGARAGIRRARRFAPQVVVMDINMPGMSGVEATPLMLDIAPEASILMLTIATDEAEVLDCPEGRRFGLSPQGRGAVRHRGRHPCGRRGPCHDRRS